MLANEREFFVTCKNCVFWQRRTIYQSRTERDTYSDDPRYFVGKNPIATPSRFGDCNCSVFVYTQSGGDMERDDLDPDNPVNGLIYSDGEAYGAYFYTGEDFGCIHFMEK